jgi:hypothetical protein
VNRQVTVGLKVFYSLLTSTQGGNFRLQVGDFLDLGFKPLDLGRQIVVLSLLRRDLCLIPPAITPPSMAAVPSET